MIASVLAHTILARVAPRRNTVMLYLAAGLIVGLTLIGWAGWTFGVLSIEFVSAALTYAAFCELYIFLFTLALSSVSANILVRLAAGPKDAVALDVSYDSPRMVEQRLTRMKGAGLIVWKTHGFRLTRRGAVIVKAYRLLRQLFRHT